MLKMKMLRDIRKNLSQFITIFLMIVLGLMVYSGIRSYMQGMKITAEEFYESYHLQDIDVIGLLTRKDADTIKKINGVKNVEGKVTLTGTIKDEEDKTIQINFIDTNKISEFYIKEGTSFIEGKPGVWINEYYAENNNLKVGDILKLKYAETVIEEEIKGIINVPDHVYSSKDVSEVYPNHRDYGFCYISINEFPKDYIKETVAKSMGLNDKNLIPDFNIKDVLKFTSIMVELEDNANREEVKKQIEEKVEKATAIMNIEDENSYTIYQTEIDEGETYAGVFTTLFLLIAILSVVTTMTRVVKKQRIQIGTLKALGISKRKINRHYVSYILWIAIIASIIGIIAGPFTIGKVFISMEMNLFQIPNGRPILENSSFAIAVGVIIIVCLVTYITCRKELKKNPAETLRTEMPKVKGKGLNFTAKGPLKALSFSSKWNIRDMLRNKSRTIMGIFGIAGCMMLLVCACGMLDTMNHYINWQFDDLYNFEYKIMLKPNYTNKEFKEINKYYGTATSQTLGVEVKFGDRKETNNIFVANSEDYIKFTNKDIEFIKLKDERNICNRKISRNRRLKRRRYSNLAYLWK